MRSWAARSTRAPSRSPRRWTWHLTDRADSAGQPWQGRHFGAHGAPSTDDGSAPPALLAALERFHAGEAGAAEVVDALREVRLLVPLVAHAGDEGVTDAGLRVDKTQELSLVTVAGPGGRAVLPAFTSVGALSLWNNSARPIPVEARRVALAAAAEGTELIVIDPGSPTEFGVRRPAVWAIAQGEPWRPPSGDPAVVEAFESTVAEEPGVVALRLVDGDPGARLTAPEVTVVLALVPGLARDDLTALTGRLREQWSEHPVIAARVDSLGVKLTAVS